jgi:hypothetical protein
MKHVTPTTRMFFIALILVGLLLQIGRLQDVGLRIVLFMPKINAI